MCEKGRSLKFYLIQIKNVLFSNDYESDLYSLYPRKIIIIAIAFYLHSVYINLYRDIEIIEDPKFTLFEKYTHVRTTCFQCFLSVIEQIGVNT